MSTTSLRSPYHWLFKLNLLLPLGATFCMAPGGANRTTKLSPDRFDAKQRRVGEKSCAKQMGYLTYQLVQDFSQQQHQQD